MNIENCVSSDPNKFWDFIKRLGPTKREEIPWKIELDGQVITDQDLVLKKWKEDYENQRRSIYYRDRSLS